MPAPGSEGSSCVDGSPEDRRGDSRGLRGLSGPQPKGSPREGLNSEVEGSEFKKRRSGEEAGGIQIKRSRLFV